MQQERTLVLEIIREGDVLKMGIFERREISATLRHYSQQRVDFNEVDQLCREITALLGCVNPEEPHILRGLEKASHALWDHLLTRQVKEKLKAGLNSSLLLEIDEELIFIPWELLNDGENFLCLIFNLGRLVRTKSKIAASEYRSPAHLSRMLILANPTNDLKSAYLEGLSIRNQFDRKHAGIRIDFKSTNIDRLYVKKYICDYDIVHFAGHCQYSHKSPKESGWVLSDGNFSIQDIMRLGAGSCLPALVFSNACHSALPAQEILIDSDYQKQSYSLASAFLFSGVRHYIGAIRRIEDKASLAFAREFYYHLVSGKPLGLSLRLARIKLLKDYGVAAMHWANYLLYGDPGFILFAQKHLRQKKKLAIPKKYLRQVIIFASAILLAALFLMLVRLFNPASRILYLNAKRLSSRGENARAIKEAQKLIARDRGFLDAYPLLGDTYHRIGEREKAVKCYFDYMLAAQGRNDSRHLVSAYLSIGWFYQLDGEYKKAREFYEKAISLSRQADDRLNEAVALRRLAAWNIDRRDYEAALQLLTKSSEINRQRQHLAAHRYNLACDYFDIGLVFSNQDDTAAAQEFYRKSRELFERADMKSELSDYYFNLGELYTYEKQYGRALDSYLAGLNLDLAAGDKRNLASDYNMIGELYLEMDNFAEAELNLNRALEASEGINSRPDIAASCHNLGILYRKTGKKAKSRQFLRRAQEIYSEIDPLAYAEVKEEILSLP
jgi:tetratricopeptide (TPR) repeat protein